jgi:hypothetical protein
VCVCVGCAELVTVDERRAAGEGGARGTLAMAAGVVRLVALAAKIARAVWAIRERSNTKACLLEIDARTSREAAA